MRLRLVNAARRMSVLGLNQGKSGNLSARAGEGFFITPSGRSYESMSANDLAFIDAHGESHGPHAPSSEWRLHHDIYARHPRAAAIVHTHSPFATTLACLRRDIPAFHYEVAFAGGNDIRCAPYATFGTQELSDFACSALDGRRACLLANHGVVAHGADLEQALGLAEKVEALARLYCQALPLGEPALLDPVEMERIVDKFKGYGR
jgi:L-fuculose-phosphate aldolase